MRDTSALETWHPNKQRQTREAKKIAGILESAGIELNGPNAWDIRVHDDRLFSRLLAEGTLGLGESYMDGWWDVAALDEFFYHARQARLDQRADEWGVAWLALKSRLLNLQSKALAKRVAEEHYDLGNDLYQAMLDRRMQYSCAYWSGASTLEQAQRNKLDLICRKLKLKPGMRVLEIGSGFGGFAHFAATEYGCEVVGYNISREQVTFATARCASLPVRFEQKDYRDAISEGQSFDSIVSIGMFEHVGYKNYRVFLEVAHALLKPHGLFLLHTIGGNVSHTYTDPWVHKYIFPNGLIPSIAQLGNAMAGLWVAEDWHNFGPDYDRTLMCWWDNFEQAWPKLRGQYGDRFYRMWKYYLLSCAGSFRARALQLWQIVLSRGDIEAYTSVR